MNNEEIKIICKANIRVNKKEYMQCSRNAVIDGYCMNHYTSLVYKKDKRNKK